MPAYPSAQAKYDISNPASYSGTGNTLYDISGNSFNITLNNVSYSNSAEIVPIIEFLGTSTSFGYYNGAIANINSATAVFTFNIWVKAFYDVSAPGYEACFGYGRDGDPSIGGIPSLWLDRNGNNITFDFGSSNPVINSGYAAPNIFQLYSIVNNGTTVTLYINGISYGSASSTGRQVRTPPVLCLGGFDTDFTNVGYPSDFKLAYLEIHNTALSAAQILEFFQTTSSTYLPVTTPVSELDLSNPASFSGSGLTVYDLSGNNNDFYFSGSGYTYSTVTGGEVTYNSANVTLFRPTPVFNDYTFGTSPFSFHVWCKLLANGGLDLSQMWCGNFTGGSGANNNPFLFANGYSSNNEITFTDGTSSAALGTSVVIGEWNLYSVVKPENAGVSGVQVYLNGNLLTNTNTNNTPINVSQATIPGQLQSRMGIAGSAHTAPDQGNVYNGTWTLGEFQFFDTAIGASQVQDFFANTNNRYNPPVLSFEINAANPASYSGSGTTVYDLSPAARVGNLDSSTFGSSTWSPNFGGIFTLDGFNDIFEFSGGGVAVSQPGSISVWFRSNAPFNAGNVVSQGLYGTNGWGLNLGQAYGANPNILSLVSHGVGYRSSGVGVTVGEWAFVTLNYNVNGTSNLFINGGLGATMAAIGMNPPQQLIRIGYDGGGPAQPEIDVAQVYMYDAAISLADHITLYDATKTPFLPAAPVPIQNSNVGGRSFNKGLNG